jgi:mannose-1-phosphate guanylyltransferase/mannose-6-phosphate isomerase
MISVIIAGGSGTRLWPLSTPDYPKHLLSLNGGKSLVQNTYERAKKVSDKIYVLTEISHAHHVKEQLPDLDDEHFIIEPARRGTASCIIAGLERISRSNKTDEPIAFIAADHYIRDSKGFAHSFKVAETISKRDGRIVLVGAEPDYPSTGFGYIEKGKVFDEESFVFEVSQFKEKPSHDKAQQYVKSGNYLWNCGYFVASIDTFLEIMKKHAPMLHDNYQALSQSSTEEDYESTYLDFENIAIDYALIEKTDNLLAVPASFDWMDLGSFGDLHKAVESDESGNHTRGSAELEAVENSYIHNSTQKPVAVIGLDNVVIVNTENGLLVARKDLSQKIGDVSKRINGKPKSDK